MNPNLEIALALWGFGMYWSLRCDHLMDGGFDWYGLRRAITLAPWWPVRLGGWLVVWLVVAFWNL